MKYAYLFIPALVIFLLPLIKALVDGHNAMVARKAQIAAKEARETARREAIRKANEARESKKAAEEAAKAAMPKRKPGRPRKNPLPEQRPQIILPDPVPAPIPQPVTYRGNNVFAGHVVAFTGTLPGMTRREAIEAVEQNGGQAFDTMPAATTLLVVGDRPGTRKQDKADEWQSCRKITAQQFFAMLHTPLTLEPDAFVSFLCQRLEKNNA